MATETPTSGLQMRSLITGDGQLKLSLETIATPEPAADEIVVRVEAAPINPSDLGLLLGAADMTTAKVAGNGATAVVTATVPTKLMPAMAGRVDQSMPVGNEGAGVVVKAGSSDAAQAMLGQSVAMIGGAMYSQYRCVNTADVIVLPPDASPADGASSFVNPLTALGMVETMRREGHTALVHTAAASNLGQMLNRICIMDGIALVNIVRSDEQVALLRGMGATWVCNANAPTFMDDLGAALVDTGATLAFDAIGGGKLAGQILTGMEMAASKNVKAYSRYGSAVHKQVYIYGGLDTAPTELNRNFGMAWGIGGWLLFPFLQKVGPDVAQTMRDRVARELKTTFASHYSKEISLTETLQLDVIAQYNRRRTGEKYLINPSKDFTAG
jgi:NADPH:quinone reductase-like Zn-dependent oxidoreductase